MKPCRNCILLTMSQSYCINVTLNVTIINRHGAYVLTVDMFKWTLWPFSVHSFDQVGTGKKNWIKSHWDLTMGISLETSSEGSI